MNNINNELHFDVSMLPIPFNFYSFITGDVYLHFGYWFGAENVIEAQKRMTDLIISFVSDRQIKILDVGCGLGQTAIELVQRGKKVVGIAPDAELINIARMQAKNNTTSGINLTFEVSSFEEYTDEIKFDCILFQESLQYLPGLRSVFKNAAKFLEDDGLIVIGDEVRYQKELEGVTSVHLKTDILNYAKNANLKLKKNLSISDYVFKTFDFVIGQFSNRRDEILFKFKEIPDIEAVFENFLTGWKMSKRWFEENKCGYEIFVFSKSNQYDLSNRFTVCSYKKGDEKDVLPLFNQVFSQNRSMEHWLWKFRDSPYGRGCIKLCWFGERLVAQYAGYLIPMEWNGIRIKTLHLGDSITHPNYRSRVMGRNGLFVRTANAFFNEFGGAQKDKAQVMYGVNTGRIQQLGRILLEYTPINNIIQLGKNIDERVRVKYYAIDDFIYSVQSSSTVPDGADLLWMKCRQGQGLEVVRDYKYLKWRYEDCPDTDYTFWTVINRFTRDIQGIMVTRERDGIGCLVDFLCKKNGRGLWRLVKRIEESFFKSGIRKMELWISEYHFMFPLLKKYGYRLEKEPNNLAVIARSFTPDIDVNTLKMGYLYTMGDSDLF